MANPAHAREVATPPLMDGPDAEGEAEMTAIMNTEQRRLLQQATREAAAGSATLLGCEMPRPEDLTRETARPPSSGDEPAAIVDVAPLPAPRFVERARPGASPATASAASPARSARTWAAIAFAVLVAAVCISLLQ